MSHSENHQNHSKFEEPRVDELQILMEAIKSVLEECTHSESASEDVNTASDDVKPVESLSEDVELSNSLSDVVESLDSTSEDVTPSEAIPEDVESIVKQLMTCLLDDVVSSEFCYSAEQIWSIRGVPASEEFMENLEILKKTFAETSDDFRRKKKTFNFWKPSQRLQNFSTPPKRRENDDSEFRRLQNYDDLASGDYARHQGGDSEFRRRQTKSASLQRLLNMHPCDQYVSSDDSDSESPSPTSSKPLQNLQRQSFAHLNPECVELRIRHSRFRDSGIFDTHPTTSEYPLRKYYSNRLTSSDFPPMNVRSFGSHTSSEFSELFGRRYDFRSRFDYSEESFDDGYHQRSSQDSFSEFVESARHQNQDEQVETDEDTSHLHDLHQRENPEDHNVPRHQHSEEPVEVDENSRQNQNWNQQGADYNSPSRRHQNWNEPLSHEQQENSRQIQNWNQQGVACDSPRHYQIWNEPLNQVQQEGPRQNQNWNQQETGYNSPRHQQIWNEPMSHVQQENSRQMQIWNQQGDYYNAPRQYQYGNEPIGQEQRAPTTPNPYKFSEELQYPLPQIPRGNPFYNQNDYNNGYENGPHPSDDTVNQVLAYGLAPNQPFRVSHTPIKSAPFNPATNDYHYG